MSDFHFLQSAPNSAPEARVAQLEKEHAELRMALQQVKEDVRHAMGKAVTAFVKHGYAVKHSQDAGATQAVTDFDQAMEEIRLATADTPAAANAVALSDASREDMELVIARLEQIAGNFSTDYREDAQQALVCARAVLAKLPNSRTAADAGGLPQLVVGTLVSDGYVTIVVHLNRGLHTTVVYTGQHPADGEHIGVQALEDGLPDVHPCADQCQIEKRSGDPQEGCGSDCHIEPFPKRPTATSAAGLTCESLAQLIAGKCINDYGYRLLLNGDTISLNLQNLLDIVNVATQQHTPAAKGAAGREGGAA